MGLLKILFISNLTEQLQGKNTFVAPCF